jgi:hypothetical protein
VVEVGPVGESLLGELKADFESAEDLAKGLRDSLIRHFFHDSASPPLSWKLLESMVAELFAGEVPMVFLQEFRDVEHCDGSAYQAIVEAPSKLTGFRGGGFLCADHRVTVNSFDSHPIALDLGFPSGPLRPVLQTWVDFDFDMGKGKVIWNGGRKPAPARLARCNPPSANAFSTTPSVPIASSARSPRGGWASCIARGTRRPARRSR